MQQSSVSWILSIVAVVAIVSIATITMNTGSRNVNTASNQPTGNLGGQAIASTCRDTDGMSSDYKGTTNGLSYGKVVEQDGTIWQYNYYKTAVQTSFADKCVKDVMVTSPSGIRRTEPRFVSSCSAGESGCGASEGYCSDGYVKVSLASAPCSTGCYDGACRPTYFRPAEPIDSTSPTYAQ